MQDRSLSENRDSSASELAPRLVQNNIFFKESNLKGNSIS